MTLEVEIIYLPSAEKDLEDIFDYICLDNPDAAYETLLKFDTSISNLSIFPLSGVIPEDIRLQTLKYRMLIVNNYIVFYVFKENVVEIRRVLHGKRQYGFLF